MGSSEPRGRLGDGVPGRGVRQGEGPEVGGRAGAGRKERGSDWRLRAHLSLGLGVGVGKGGTMQGAEPTVRCRDLILRAMESCGGGLRRNMMELCWHLKMHLGLCVLGLSPYIT